MRYLILWLLFASHLTLGTNFNEISRMDLQAARFAKSEKQMEWAVFFLHEATEKKASSLLSRLNQKIPRHHVIYRRCQTISKETRRETNCANTKLSTNWKELTGVGRPRFLEKYYKQLEQIHNELEQMSLPNSKESFYKGSAFTLVQTKPYSRKRYNYVNVRADPHLWLTASEIDFHFSDSLWPKFKRAALFARYTAIERLLKAKIVQQGWRPYEGHYVDRLCATGNWGDFNCTGLRELNRLYLGLRYPGEMYDSILKRGLAFYWKQATHTYQQLRSLWSGLKGGADKR